MSVEINKTETKKFPYQRGMAVLMKISVTAEEIASCRFDLLEDKKKRAVQQLGETIYEGLDVFADISNTDRPDMKILEARLVCIKEGDYKQAVKLVNSVLGDAGTSDLVKKSIQDILIQLIK